MTNLLIIEPTPPQNNKIASLDADDTPIKGQETVDDAEDKTESLDTGNTSK